MELNEAQKQSAYSKLREIKLAILLPYKYADIFGFNLFWSSLLQVWTNLVSIQKDVYYWQFYNNNKQKPDKTFEIKLFEDDSFRLDERRNELVKSGMEWGATHLLFLDTDQTFPSDVAFQLLKHDMPIVGGLYYHKLPPYHPQLYTKNRESEKNLYLGLKIYQPNSLITTAGYVKDGKKIDAPIEATGMGCLLVKREVFEKLKQPPYFKFPEMYDDKGVKVGWGSEDFYFFDRIKAETDYTISIDTNVKCGHLCQPIKQITENNFIGYEWSDTLKNLI